MTIIMVIIIFYFHTVPYKWWRIWVRRITLMKSLQSQSSCSPLCTMKCFIQQFVFSSVKKCSPVGRENYEKRVGYSFHEMSLSSCVILNCLSDEKKKKKILSHTLQFHLAVFIHLLPNLCSVSASAAWLATLT